jgi:hypothetical protein
MLTLVFRCMGNVGRAWHHRAYTNLILEKTLGVDEPQNNTDIAEELCRF